MTTIEKIRAEIERRNNNAETLRERNICIDILTFIDTLEGGSSEIPNDINEAAKDYAFNNAEDGGEYNARYLGFIAGAEWGADHTPLPEDTVLFNKGVAEGRRLAEEEQADLFTIVALDAAERAKKQMMEEAVEMEVGLFSKFLPMLLVTEPMELKDFPAKHGDKVRIIIVKD